MKLSDMVMCIFMACIGLITIIVADTTGGYGRYVFYFFVLVTLFVIRVRIEE